MQQIMTRAESNHLLDGLFPALGVNGNPLQVVVRCSLQQSEIGSSQQAELFQSLFGVGVFIVEPYRPQILVVSHQLRTILCQCHAQAKAPDELGIRKMLKNVAHGPLSVGLRLLDLLSRQSMERSAQCLSGLFEHIQGISVADETQDRSNVFGCLSGSRCGGIRENGHLLFS
jgi:hypothetical protein